MDRPIIVSTLGSNLTDEAQGILKGLGIENIIVAYDWDATGKKAIAQIAKDIGGTVYYLGGMTEGQDPADKLKDVVNAISGFSLQHLMASAKRIQKTTDKPIFISHLTTGKRKVRVRWYIPTNLGRWFILFLKPTEEIPPELVRKTIEEIFQMYAQSIVEVCQSFEINVDVFCQILNKQRPKTKQTIE